MGQLPPWLQRLCLILLILFKETSPNAIDACNGVVFRTDECEVSYETVEQKTHAGTVSHTTTSTTDNRRAETQSPANQQANEAMIPYPGHDAMKDAIPYIGYFRYKNGKMSCNITCKDSHIKNLETYCVV